MLSSPALILPKKIFQNNVRTYKSVLGRHLEGQIFANHWPRKHGFSRRKPLKMKILYIDEKSLCLSVWNIWCSILAWGRVYTAKATCSPAKSSCVFVNTFPGLIRPPGQSILIDYIKDRAWGYSTIRACIVTCIKICTGQNLGLLTLRFFSFRSFFF